MQAGEGKRRCLRPSGSLASVVLGGKSVEETMKRGRGRGRDHRPVDRPRFV